MPSPWVHVPAFRRSAGCWLTPHTAVPELIRGTARLLIEEIRLLEARIAQLERELAAIRNARSIPDIQISSFTVSNGASISMVAAAAADQKQTFIAQIGLSLQMGAQAPSHPFRRANSSSKSAMEAD